MKDYNQTLKYIFSYITSRKKLKIEAESALSGPRYLLKLLGNPQEKIPLIHIAGTSGKGSTSYLINSLLQSQNFSVGLFLSPHVIDIRERFQINNKFISKQDFANIFQEIMPAIEKVNRSQFGKPSYFVITMAFAFYLFQKRKVNFAVIETGLGGLWDATNIVKNDKKLAVITRIGLDHQWHLGNTYEKIAFQKAGIIQINNNVVTINQKRSVMDVIKKRAMEQNAKLYILNRENNFKATKISKLITSFDFKFQNLHLPKVKLSLIGYHQVENAAEALATLYLLSKQYKFKINADKIYESLKNTSFPGRFEIVKNKNGEIIIDGAHNPQKMSTFIKSLANLYPKTKFNFLISFSSGKDQLLTIKGMIKKVAPVAKHIYVTEFRLIKQDKKHQAVKFSRIENVLKKIRFRNYSFVKNPNLFLMQHLKTNQDPLVITGSLYLISSLYQTIKSFKKRSGLNY